MYRKFKSIADTDILSDNLLSIIEAGACNSGCKPSCYQGRSKHGTVIIPTTFCPKSDTICISPSIESASSITAIHSDNNEIQE